MRWVIGIVLILIGVGLGVTVPAFWSISISPTVDAGNLLNAVAILAVGVIIEYLYASQSSSKRADTELLLDLVRDANRAFRQLEMISSQVCATHKKLTRDEQRGLTSLERDLSNAVHSIESALGYCQVKLHELDFEKLKDARVSLKASLTDSPFPGPYDDGSQRSIHAAFKTMRDELTRTAFAINRR
ncbi:MAG: hypothetical protein ACYDA9_08320 [Terriglobia bacterium]